MKIQILGTAAAEGWPALFCACETCQRARTAGGKNYRSRASVMINDNIKIDLNPDTYHHMVTHGLDLSRLEHLVFTHSHEDHLTPSELSYLREPFAHNRKKVPLDVWASQDVLNAITAFHQDPEARQMRLHSVKPFETYDLDGVKMTPVIAHHKQDEQCLNWLIGDLDHAVLYASDTGPYKQETLDYLAGVRLDMLISECTGGFMPDMGTHMTVPAVQQLRDQLEKSGSLNDGCTVVLTHFSHNMGLLHEEMEERVRDDGFIVAYDGIILET